MNLQRKALEGITVAGTFMVMLSIADGAKPAEAVAVAAPETIQTVEDEAEPIRVAQKILPENGVGFSSVLGNRKTEAPKIERVSTDVVAAAEEEEMTEDETVWQNRLLADVDEYLCVRASADEDSEVVGKLYKGDVAEIVDESGDWTHITSGNVDGYVSNEYCISGTDALSYANENFEITAEIRTDGLRVRTEANTESDILTAVSEGDTLTVDKTAETTDEWVAVNYKGNIGYVSAEYVKTEFTFGEAVTIEEEEAERKAEEERLEQERVAAEQRAAEAEAAKKAEIQAEAEAAKKAAEAEAAKKAAEAEAAAKSEEEPAETVPVAEESAEEVQTETQAAPANESVAASADDVTLLAALIQCEAGSECYEGQVAVGAVVMNRLRSGSYPNTLYGVIYEAHQFTPAGRGDVARVAAAGPKASCVQAAQEALNGANNVGGAVCFARASGGKNGIVIGNHVFY